MATGSDDGKVRVWEVGSGKLEQALEGGGGIFRWVAFSGDGKRLATASEDGKVRVWEVASAPG